MWGFPPMIPSPCSWPESCPSSIFGAVSSPMPSAWGPPSCWAGSSGWEPWFAPLPWGPLWHSLPGARRSTWSMARRLLSPAGRNGLNHFQKRGSRPWRAGRGGSLASVSGASFLICSGRLFPAGRPGLGKCQSPLPPPSGSCPLKTAGTGCASPVGSGFGWPV